MITQKYYNERHINEAISYLHQFNPFNPKIALVLGSGLGNIISNINIELNVNSKNIPNYPISSVDGHTGTLSFGFLKRDTNRSVPLLVFQGRIHYYETSSIEHVTFPVVLAKELGVKAFIFTNAAGGINANYQTGDIMLATDFLNFIAMDPSSVKQNIVGHNKYYDAALQKMTIKCALQLSIPLRQGTYCWIKGPSYETPAEIQTLRNIGADAVGMSTEPEILMANILNVRSLGLSLISNMASGNPKTKISHADIKEAARKTSKPFFNLLENLILSIK